MSNLHDELAALALHLTHRREALLRAWREAIRRDPALTTGDSLPRAQLHDHIPALLLSFEHSLGMVRTPGDAHTSEQDQQAAAHGLHRWQQGYDLREVARELAHLNECMVSELDGYASEHSQVSLAAMAHARRAWAELAGTTIGESTSQYFSLQQQEAYSHVRDLERALEQVRELERERSALWHQAVHDLRGNLGIVANATQGLAQPLPDHLRTKFLSVLERNVKSLHLLLEDVIDLARLQAGKERRNLAPTDVGALLTSLCEGLAPAAQQRGLWLRPEGPERLVVDADPVKVRRMTQNLVINAIKYTRQGGVTVNWGESDAKDAKRWMITVSDTGPGFAAGPGSPLAGALEAATDLARESDSDARSGDISMAQAPLPPGSASTAGQEPSQEPGEGIGLSIVKRLAELLNVTVEMESSSSDGTLFRLLLPRQYTD